jgi:hypothetical protein
VLKPPGRPTEGPCEGAGFCVLGDVNFQTGEVSEYVEDVSMRGFTVRDFSHFGIVGFGARDAKFVKNRTFNSGEYGITSFFSTGTWVISNVASGAEDAAIYVGDSPLARTKIVHNDTYDSSSGILVRNSLHGRITANKAHDNCVGIVFIADAPGPVGEYDVNANKVYDNTSACPATRRDAAHRQHRHRQHDPPKRAGHLLGRDRLRQPLRPQRLRDERAGASVQGVRTYVGRRPRCAAGPSLIDQRG